MFKDIKEALLRQRLYPLFISRKKGSEDMVNEHFRSCKYRWPYQNEVLQEEEFYRMVLSLDEVILRMGNNS
jgi:hypothetical protein